MLVINLCFSSDRDDPLFNFNQDGNKFHRSFLTEFIEISHDSVVSNHEGVKARDSVRLWDYNMCKCATYVRVMGNAVVDYFKVRLENVAFHAGY